MSNQTASGVPEWDLADRLHKALRWAGLSVADMADHLDVHRNTIGNYLRGREPSRATLIAWAMRCGVPFEWLAYGRVSEGPDSGPGLVIDASRWRRESAGRRALIAVA